MLSQALSVLAPIAAHLLSILAAGAVVALLATHSGSQLVGAGNDE